MVLLTALQGRLDEAGDDRSRADQRGGAVLAEDEDEVDADVAVAPCWIQWVKTTRRTMTELAGKLSGRQDDGECGNGGGGGIGPLGAGGRPDRAGDERLGCRGSAKAVVFRAVAEAV